MPSVALALVLALAGCASAPQSRFDPTAAGELQSAVLAVSEAAHEGAFGEAAGQLDELEAATIAAFSRGEMSQSRFDAIMVAIELVRADLAAAIEAAQQPDPAETSTGEAPAEGSDGSSGSSGTGTGGGAPTEPAPEPEPEPESEPGGNGNGRGNPGVPGPPDDRGKPND